jgi:hypothetical protein
MHSVFIPAVHLAPCDYGSRKLRNYCWWRHIDVRMQNWIPSSRATWKWILYDNWPTSPHSFPYKLPHFNTASFSFHTLPLKIGPIGCPETSVLKQPVLRNNPEDGRVQIYCCLKFSQIPSLFLTISLLQVNCYWGWHRKSYTVTPLCLVYTRWFKYDRDYLRVNKSQFVPVIFEPPCTKKHMWQCDCNQSSFTRSLVPFSLWWSLDITRSKGKGKAFPLQASAGPSGSGRLRLTDFLDFRHYEGGKVVTLTHRPSLPPGLSWYLFLEVESTPGHMVQSVATEKILSGVTGDFVFCSLYFVCTTSLSWLSRLCLFSLLCNSHNTNIHAPGGIRTPIPRSSD